MAGLTFYLVSWGAWTITTFFVCKKNEYRYKVTIIILLLIILSPYYINIFNYDIYLSIFLLLFVAYGYFVKQNYVSTLSLLVSSFIICIAYVSFHLFELYDPVWLLFSREWLIASLMAFLAIFLHRDFFQRLMVVFLGIVHGEVLFSVMLNKLSLKYPIGTEAFLDVIAVNVTMLCIWKVLENAASVFDQYGTIFEREKRKQL